jgi:hypothetical protein
MVFQGAARQALTYINEKATIRLCQQDDGLN